MSILEALVVGIVTAVVLVVITYRPVRPVSRRDDADYVSWHVQGTLTHHRVTEDAFLSDHEAQRRSRIDRRMDRDASVSRIRR